MLSVLSLSNTIILAMSLLISGTNAILRVVLGAMSRLEAKHTITDQLASMVGKMWVVQYCNIVILLFLINTKYNKLFETSGNADILPILNGKHSDFTGAWYGEVGTAIATTTFISCVTPVAQLYHFFLSCLGKCAD